MIVKNSQSPSEQIAHLAESTLFDLARNESASVEFRRAAVGIMLDKGYKKAGHPELGLILAEIKKEREARGEVEAIVESAIESPIPQSPALTASVTTKSLFGGLFRQGE